MLSAFFSSPPTWLRKASASRLVALCQQNVNHRTVIKKKEGGGGREPSRAKSHQCFHSLMGRKEREEEGREWSQRKGR